jgi:hypothetical protein
VKTDATLSFVVRARGDWTRGQVRARWTSSGRKVVREVENGIATAWAEASARLGEKLFDGPMCRLEGCASSPAQLLLTLSRTSYKPFLGTNLLNGHFADQFGPEVMANPVGVSTLLQTVDGWLLLGRRNDSVAYYPNRVHPFAGAIEPQDGELDVFAEVRRELREELSLNDGDIADMRCIGLVEDRQLRQPELIFVTTAELTYEQIASRLDRTEHVGCYAVKPNRADIDRAVADPLVTPVAAASVLLWVSSGVKRE